MSNFTLKEAFICAGALLLIAITAPLAIGNATNDAKLAACADKLRQVGAAQLSYADNNKSFLPMNEKNFIKGGGMARAATYSNGMPPMVLIQKGYFKKGAADGEKVVDTRERIFHCPADDVNFVRAPYLGWHNPVQPGISYFYCWFSTQKGLKSYSFPHKTKPEQDDSFGLRANVERDDPGRFIYADLIRATNLSGTLAIEVLNTLEKRKILVALADSEYANPRYMPALPLNKMTIINVLERYDKHENTSSFAIVNQPCAKKALEIMFNMRQTLANSEAQRPITDMLNE